MVVQRDAAWLKGRSPEEIAAADDAGELDELRGRPIPTLAGPEIGSIPGLQRDQEWVDRATPEQIAAAFNAGELDVLLGKIPPVSNDPEKPSEGLYGDGTVRTHEPLAPIPNVLSQGPAIPAAAPAPRSDAPTPGMDQQALKG